MEIVAIALIVIGGFFAVMNLACLVSTIVTKKYSSMVPPLGGLLLAIGFALHPDLRAYAVCGLLLDVGFWAFLLAIPMLLGEILRATHWRRVASLSGQWQEITFKIRFYRPDYYDIRVSRSRSSGESGGTGRGSFGHWYVDNNEVHLVSRIDAEDSPSKLVLAGELGADSLRVVESTFSSRDEMPEFPPVGTILTPASQRIV